MIRAVLLDLLLWVGFGAVHSGLAAAPGRRWLARHAGAADRLAYNLIAAVHLALVLWLSGRLFAGRHAYMPVAIHVVGALVALAGAAILIAAGRSYDLARFVGTAQIRRATADAAQPPEPLATGGMNAVVRHPLYLGLLLLLWGLATSPFRLATAVFATIYILVGIRFEERKLLRLYGATYAAYRARVPMLVPRWSRLH